MKTRLDPLDEMFVWCFGALFFGIGWTPLGSIFVPLAETSGGKTTVLIIFSGLGLLGAFTCLIMVIVCGRKLRGRP